MAADETYYLTIHGRPVECEIMWSAVDGLTHKEAATRIKRMEDAMRPPLRRKRLKEIQDRQTAAGMVL